MRNILFSRILPSTFLLVALFGFSAHAADVAFDLRIERGRVPANMRVIRVKQGDHVTLRWSSDRAINLHLHGYDIEKKLEPGSAADMTFHARATGRFPVEIHTSKAGGGGHSHGEAPLVQVEVHPR